MNREEALALLRHNHEFPGHYEFRVVILPAVMGAVVATVSAAVGGSDNVVEVSSRASRTGKYVSVRMKISVESAEMVLDVYALLREQDGVITTM